MLNRSKPKPKRRPRGRPVKRRPQGPTMTMQARVSLPIAAGLFRWLEESCGGRVEPKPAKNLKAVLHTLHDTLASIGQLRAFSGTAEAVEWLYTRGYNVDKLTKIAGGGEAGGNISNKLAAALATEITESVSNQTIYDEQTGLAVDKETGELADL